MIAGHAHFGLKGEYRAILRDPDESIVVDTGWKPNLILDNGLIQMGTTSDWARYFHIGSSNTAPAVGQTTLSGYLGSASGAAVADATVQGGSPDYETTTTRSKRFAAGVGTGTIREMGVGGTNGNSNMSIRALVSPEITKSALQVLDLYWRLTVFPKITDTDLEDIDVSEDGVSVLYDTKSRLAEAGTMSGTIQQLDSLDMTDFRFYAGAIGAVTGSPSGASAGGYPGYLDFVSKTAPTLAGASAYSDFVIRATLDIGNPTGGIRCVKVGYVSNLRFQHQFTDVATGTRLIPKNNTRQLDLTFRTTWTRL